MTSLLGRLRERKLVQWALAYLAGAWLLLQVLDLHGDNFDWPRLIVRSATVVLGVGFLAALVLAHYPILVPVAVAPCSRVLNHTSGAGRARPSNHARTTSQFSKLSITYARALYLMRLRHLAGDVPASPQ